MLLVPADKALSSVTKVGISGEKVTVVSEAGPVMKSLVCPPGQSWAAMSSVSYWWDVTGKLQDSGVLRAHRCLQHLRSSQDG